jgi:hypothetical protein
VIRLHIFPTPTADEAAAIEAAIKALVAAQAVRASGLRYGDVAAFTGISPATQSLAIARPLRWRDAARLESLEPGV